MRSIFTWKPDTFCTHPPCPRLTKWTRLDCRFFFSFSPFRNPSNLFPCILSSFQQQRRSARRPAGGLTAILSATSLLVRVKWCKRNRRRFMDVLIGFCLLSFFLMILVPSFIYIYTIPSTLDLVTCVVSSASGPVIVVKRCRAAVTAL